MFCHLPVASVQDGFVFCVLNDAGLEIVRHEDAGHTTEVTVGIDVSIDPRLLLFIQKGFCISVTAVRQDGNEQVCRDQFAGVGVHDSHGISRPVHLHGFTGLVVEMHRSLRLVDIVCVVLVELRGLVWDFSCCAALLTVFYPQQAQRDAALLHLLVDLLIVRHTVHRMA